MMRILAVVLRQSSLRPKEFRIFSAEGSCLLSCCLDDEATKLPRVWKILGGVAEDNDEGVRRTYSVALKAESKRH